jgi:hypothetical protein
MPVGMAYTPLPVQGDPRKSIARKGFGVFFGDRT